MQVQRSAKFLSNAVPDLTTNFENQSGADFIIDSYVGNNAIFGTHKGSFSNLEYRLLYPTWYHLVEVYTGSNLSFATDRFPAIWSLANMFQKESGDRYVAGLWEKDLLRELVFSREVEGTPSLAVNTASPLWS